METTQITASYEEALLFVKNSVVEDGKKALDRCMKDGTPMMVSGLITAESTIKAGKTIAFIYGKSDEQVMKDISNTLDGLIKKEENQ